VHVRVFRGYSGGYRQLDLNFEFWLVAQEQVLVVNAAQIAEYPERSPPHRIEPDVLVIGRCRARGNQVPVLVVDVQIQVRIAAAADRNLRPLASAECDSVHVHGSRVRAPRTCSVPSRRRATAPGASSRVERAAVRGSSKAREVRVPLRAASQDRATVGPCPLLFSPAVPRAPSIRPSCFSSA
jgi:hypothetical protein